MAVLARKNVGRALPHTVDAPGDWKELQLDCTSWKIFGVQVIRRLAVAPTTSAIIGALAANCARIFIQNPRQVKAAGTATQAARALAERTLQRFLESRHSRPFKPGTIPS